MPRSPPALARRQRGLSVAFRTDGRAYVFSLFRVPPGGGRGRGEGVMTPAVLKPPTLSSPVTRCIGKGNGSPGEGDPRFASGQCVSVTLRRSLTREQGKEHTLVLGGDGELGQPVAGCRSTRPKTLGGSDPIGVGRTKSRLSHVDPRTSKCTEAMRSELWRPLRVPGMPQPRPRCPAR